MSIRIGARAVAVADGHPAAFEADKADSGTELDVVIAAAVSAPRCCPRRYVHIGPGVYGHT